MNYLLMVFVFFSTGYRGSLDKEVSVLPKPTLVNTSFILLMLAALICAFSSLLQNSPSSFAWDLQGREGSNVKGKKDAWDLMKTE